MGKIVYNTVAFQAPPPISESEFNEVRTVLERGGRYTKCVNGYSYFKVYKPYLIIFIFCLPIGILAEINRFKYEWVGLLADLALFFIGVKILLTLPHYLVYLFEIRKFNQHFNNIILKCKDYQHFYYLFYSDKRYYEEL